MKPFRYSPVSLLLGCSLVAFLLAGCTPDDVTYQGYIEGEYLYLAAPQGGYLKSLDAARGSRVADGQTVFSIAGDPDEQALAEAEAKAGAAREKLENLKEPHRPSEIATLAANLRAAEAAQRLAQIQLGQQQSLAGRNFVSQARLDEARSNYQQTSAQVDAARQQLASYQATFGRQAEVLGARADLGAAEAQAAQKRWLVERKTMVAPAPGEINETYFRPGEWVPAGAPVASLLPDARRRLRFFVPETVVAKIHPGDSVEAGCDGCTEPIRARIDFIAAQAEYTPPVIYSRGSREKLVFRVEAVPPPEQAARLRPGLPIDVRLGR